MENKDVKHIMTNRLQWIYLTILVLFLLLIVRIINLQTVEKQKILDATLVTQKKIIQASRGDILARDGKVLASSLPTFFLHWDLTLPSEEDFNNNIDTIAYTFAKVFADTSAQEYKNKILIARKNKSQFFRIKDKATQGQIAQIKSLPLFRRGRYKSGLIVERIYTREMPNNQLAYRTIGYMDKSQRYVGMEGCFNNILAGTQGSQWMRKLSSGDWVPIGNDNRVSNINDDCFEVEAQDGMDIISTLDINIQDLAERSLKFQLQKNQAKRGCVIVMEVNTGQIRAIANFERQKDSSYQEQRNYAVSFRSDPGSTFKLASIIAVLEKNPTLKLTDSIDTENGVYQISQDFAIKDDHKGGMGKLSISQVIEKSSNVGTAMLVNSTFRNNPQEFLDRLSSLHLDKKTGIELEGEIEPYIKEYNTDGWSNVTIPQMSIGYELEVTPLQTLTFYNAIANNGVMLRPTILQAISYHGKIQEEFEPEVLNSSICSQRTLSMVHSMLEKVVENGTAKNIKSSKYKIAGKTGTAQLARGNRGYKDSIGISYQASFVGFFPSQKPKYSCIVVIYEPSRESYYGSSVAAPVFKEIADKLYALDYDMQERTYDLVEYKDKQKVVPYSKNGNKNCLENLYDFFGYNYEMDTQKQWVSTRLKEDTIKGVSIAMDLDMIPDVKGMGAKDAVYLLERRGLQVIINGRGRVVEQSLPSGYKYKKGEKITLQLN